MATIITHKRLVWNDLYIVLDDGTIYEKFSVAPERMIARYDRVLHETGKDHRLKFDLCNDEERQIFMKGLAKRLKQFTTE